jgi:hypothetical protein
VGGGLSGEWYPYYLSCERIKNLSPLPGELSRGKKNIINFPAPLYSIKDSRGYYELKFLPLPYSDLRPLILLGTSDLKEAQKALTLPLDMR